MDFLLVLGLQPNQTSLFNALSSDIRDSFETKGINTLPDPKMNNKSMIMKGHPNKVVMQLYSLFLSKNKYLGYSFKRQKIFFFFW